MSAKKPIDLEKKLWIAANQLRSHLDAAAYKHVVLGIIFLKFIYDQFDEVHRGLKSDDSVDEEDKAEYSLRNVFWVPEEARWERIRGATEEEKSMGTSIDEAMLAIEKGNKELENTLPIVYAKSGLSDDKLDQLFELFSTIDIGGKQNEMKDVLGSVFEYFLGEFATEEGKKAGQFYTPRSVVNLMVKLLRPTGNCRIYDPCCGSGGMFVMSEKWLRQCGNDMNNITFFGQESNPTTWRLAKMNMKIRQLNVKLGEMPADTFIENQHAKQKVDFILANPPFNMSHWGREKLLKDPRWEYGTPPQGNSNYAWLQHMIAHLDDDGIAAIILANGSLSAKSVESEIRQGIIDADLLDCVISLPDKLFLNTAVPCSLWILNKNKARKNLRNRRGETLFIDCKTMGSMKELPDGKISRKQRELSEKEQAEISDTYHAWKGSSSSNYQDEAGYCRSTDKDEISKHKYVITPGRYVGVPPLEDTGVSFEDEMRSLASELGENIEKSRQLEDTLLKTLRGFNIDE